MVIARPSRALETLFIVIAIVLLASAPALAQQGSVLPEDGPASGS
ncbi:hypothetical protein [Mesorhizobium sp. M0046]